MTVLRRVFDALRPGMTEERLIAIARD